jgi:hypothetical protein
MPTAEVLLARPEVAIDRCGAVARAKLAIARNLVAATAARRHTGLRRNFQRRVIATLMRHAWVRWRRATAGLCRHSRL